MELQTITPKAVATAVWANATRSLTQLGGCFAGPTNNTFIIPASGFQDMRTVSLTRMRFMSCGILSTSTGVMGLFDGTNFFTKNAINNNNVTTDFMVGNIQVGMEFINTSGATAMTACYNLCEWIP